MYVCMYMLGRSEAHRDLLEKKLARRILEESEKHYLVQLLYNQVKTDKCHAFLIFFYHTSFMA